MGAPAGIKHYSDFEVLSSQPGIEAAMHLVRLNALESGATADRMFLKVRAGSLAGLDLLWDQPSLSWVNKAEMKPVDSVTRWVVTKRAPNMPEGCRTLIGPCQGRETFATRDEARAKLVLIQENNSSSLLESMGMTDLKVMPCECWPVHFDPKGVWFWDVRDHVCLCGAPVAAGEGQCHECRDGFSGAELAQGVE